MAIVDLFGGMDKPHNVTADAQCFDSGSILRIFVGNDKVTIFLPVTAYQYAKAVSDELNLQFSYTLPVKTEAVL
jgi:hypothetical protein